MVYGYVDYSPCVIYRDEITETDLNGDISVLVDNTVLVNNVEISIEGFEGSNFLNIFKNKKKGCRIDTLFKNQLFNTYY